MNTTAINWQYCLNSLVPSLHLLVHLYTDGYLQVNNSKSAITLKFNRKEINWESEENLLRKLESEKIVKQVFPLHGVYTYMSYQIFSRIGVTWSLN